jgi:hypothetical protein
MLLLGVRESEPEVNAYRYETEQVVGELIIGVKTSSVIIIMHRCTC